MCCLQAYLLMKSDQPGVAVPLSEGLLAHAHSMWIQSCKNIRVSGLHRDVARVLTLMGLTHTIEQLTEDSLFSVDIALTGAPAPSTPPSPPAVPSGRNTSQHVPAFHLTAY